MSKWERLEKRLQANVKDADAVSASTNAMLDSLARKRTSK